MRLVILKWNCWSSRACDLEMVIEPQSTCCCNISSSLFLKACTRLTENKMIRDAINTLKRRLILRDSSVKPMLSQRMNSGSTGYTSLSCSFTRSSSFSTWSVSWRWSCNCKLFCTAFYFLGDEETPPDSGSARSENWRVMGLSFLSSSGFFSITLDDSSY